MKLFLISGLPRSGRHFLTEVINQNPKFFAITKTPLCELVYRQFNMFWDRDRIYQKDLVREETQKMQYPFLREYIENFYSNFTNKKIIFDSSSTWHTRYNIWMLKLIYGVEPKVICCVRNMEEIVSSYTKLFDDNKKFFEDSLLRDDNNLIKTYNELWRTKSSSFRNALHIVKYDDLIDDHDNTMKKIYKFINQPYYKADLNKIKRDKVYDKVEEINGLQGLHNVKPGLNKSKINVKEILSEIQIKHWKKMNWWNK